MLLLTILSGFREIRYEVLWGGFALFWTSVEVITGQALRRLDGPVIRKEDPKGFWWEVSWHFLIGLGLIAYAIFKYFNGSKP